MNKKKLFNTILITLLIFVGLTWIIKTGSYTEGTYTEGSLEPLGIFDIFYIPLQAFQTYVQYGLYLLVVGGFYGILKKTGAYKTLIEKIGKIKNKTVFMIITVIIFSILSSILGIQMGLFVLVPFFKDALIEMGYEKKNAMLATIGAIFVGIIGSTLAFDINGYINYFYNVGYNSLLLAKILILVLITIVLIIYIKKTNKEFNQKEYEKSSNTKTLPAIVISLITIIIGFIGMYSWSYGHNIEIFNNLHNSISEIKLGDFSIASSIIGKNAIALGMWSELEFAALLLIASLIISWIYNLKTKEIYEGFVDGAKELLPMSIFVTLSFVVLMPLYSSKTGQSIFYTILDKIISLSKTVSIIPMVLLSSVGTFLYGQFIYLSSDLSTALQAAYTATETYPLMTLIMQTIYGLTLFVTPTSMLLLGGLSYFDINYKEWIKHILKFILIALVILIVVFLIISWVI